MTHKAIIETVLPGGKINGGITLSVNFLGKQVANPNVSPTRNFVWRASMSKAYVKTKKVKLGKEWKKIASLYPSTAIATTDLNGNYLGGFFLETAEVSCSIKE